MSQGLYFFEEGINADLNDINGWHERAIAWVQRRTGDDANAHRYHVSAWDRWMHQGKNIENAAECIRRAWDPAVDPETKRQACPLIGVGHSNGCAILCGVIGKYPEFVFDELHLIAAAEESSFVANGLNAAIERGQVGRVVCYCSTADEALKIAKDTGWVKKIFSKWGYGYMGLEGPTYVSRAAQSRVYVNWRSGFKHSDYFAGMNFEDTMFAVTHGGERF